MYQHRNALTVFRVDSKPQLRSVNGSAKTASHQLQSSPSQPTPWSATAKNVSQLKWTYVPSHHALCTLSNTDPLPNRTTSPNPSARINSSKPSSAAPPSVATSTTTKNTPRPCRTSTSQPTARHLRPRNAHNSNNEASRSAAKQLSPQACLLPTNRMIMSRGYVRCPMLCEIRFAFGFGFLVCLATNSCEFECPLRYLRGVVVGGRRVE